MPLAYSTKHHRVMADTDEEGANEAIVQHLLALGSSGRGAHESVSWVRLGAEKGYLGRCWRCHGTILHPLTNGVKEEGMLQPVSFSAVVKAPPCPSSPLHAFVLEHRLLEAEVAFYTLLTRLCTEDPLFTPPRLPAYLFHLEHPPRLILQDMSMGSYCPDFARGLSVAECQAAVRQVARLHLITLDGLPPPCLPHANVLAEHCMHDHLLGPMYRETVVEVRKRMPGLCVREDDWQRLEGLGERVLQILRRARAENRPRRLVNGDFWCGNVLFSEAESRERSTRAGEDSGLEEDEGRGSGDVKARGAVDVVALLDFQFASFQELEWLDVIMMVASSLSTEDRRQHQHHVFQSYVEARTDLRTAEDRARLCQELTEACLPMGLCFVLGFGSSTLLTSEARGFDRLRGLIEDFIRHDWEGPQAVEDLV